MVLLVHAYYRGPELPHGPLSKLLVAGWMGVDLFFCLSGFLITSILIQARLQPSYFRNFYVKRAGRIVPIFAGLLIVLFVASFFADLFPAKVASPLRGVAQNVHIYAFFAANLSSVFGWDLASANVILGPVWSLCVEEHFYMVWPAVILVLSDPRFSLRLLCNVTGLALLVSILARWALVDHGDSDLVYHFTLTRLDGLLLGSLLAIMIARHRLGHSAMQAGGAAAFAAGLAGLFMVYWIEGSLHYSTASMQVFGYTASALLWVGFIALGLAFRPMRRALALNVLRLFGRYSYSIYLFHWPLLLLLDQARWAPGYLSYMFYILIVGSICLFLGWLIFVAYERPAALFIRRVGLR